MRRIIPFIVILIAIFMAWQIVQTWPGLAVDSAAYDSGQPAPLFPKLINIQAK